MLRTLYHALPASHAWRTSGVAMIALMLLACPVLAIGPGGGGGGGGGGVGGNGQGGSGGEVPEINPTAAMSALTILVGGTLILTDRLRRRPRPTE
jgi:hypothetical protein